MLIHTLESVHLIINHFKRELLSLEEAILGALFTLSHRKVFICALASAQLAKLWQPFRAILSQYLL